MRTLLPHAKRLRCLLQDEAHRDKRVLGAVWKWHGQARDLDELRPKVRTGGVPEPPSELRQHGLGRTKAEPGQA